MRRATYITGAKLHDPDFYPRSPCGERRPENHQGAFRHHFYPRSPCGERLIRPYANFAKPGFLSTLSLRRATRGGIWRYLGAGFLSTLSLRRATARRESRQQPAGISIHALLAESDYSSKIMILVFGLISIHALLAESDGQTFACWYIKEIFLSTLSLRRATPQINMMGAPVDNFYPRSPCGERPQWRTLASGIYGFLSTLSLRRATPRTEQTPPPFWISIHALLAESDQPATGRNNKNNIFLSTLSLRRATCASPFSIFWICHFYPRSPCGERRANQNVAHSQRKFLSTLSLRRATCFRIPYWFKVTISIHALLAESDSAPRITPTASRNFYPRSPCGERPVLNA